MSVAACPATRRDDSIWRCAMRMRSYTVDVVEMKRVGREANDVSEEMLTAMVENQSEDDLEDWLPEHGEDD